MDPLTIGLVIYSIISMVLHSYHIYRSRCKISQCCEADVLSMGNNESSPRNMR